MDNEKNLDNTKAEAETLVNNPQLLKELADKAFTKAFRFETQLRGVKSEFDLIVRLLKSWGGGRYKEVSWSSILIITGALVYFVNPFDAIPDFLPFFGLSDDLSVFTLALSRVRGELNAFRGWEKLLNSQEADQENSSITE